MQTDDTQSPDPKPEVAPVPIWRCRNPECKAWIREELAASSKPDCPLCSGSMVRSIKHLPKLMKKSKSVKKKKEDPWLH